jgi:hypothetical protein
MSILAKDTQVGHTYTSQTGVDYLIQEIHTEPPPGRVVVLKVATGEIKDDVDPMYGFVAEKEGAEVAMEPQNQDQEVEGAAAGTGVALDENRDPAELSQPNAAVETGGVVKNHNPLHPVRRSPPIARRQPPASPVPQETLAPPPVVKASVPAPAIKTPIAAPKIMPKSPAARTRSESVQVQSTKNAKNMTELEAEEKELLNVRRQANARLKMIEKLKVEEKAKNDPHFLGSPKIDANPELCQRLREDGVPVKELVETMGQRSFDLFFARGMKMVKTGNWSEFSVSNGVVIAKKTK